MPRHLASSARRSDGPKLHPRVSDERDSLLLHGILDLMGAKMPGDEEHIFKVNLFCIRYLEYRNSVNLRAI